MPTITKMNIQNIKAKILPLIKRHGISKLGLFGSCVRGEMSDDSDIDILVEIDNDISLLDFVGIKLEFEKVLGRKVDLIEYCTIKPLMRDKILKEQVVLF